MEYKKNPKIDVGRNSSIYFLIGINLMLFITLMSLKHKTYEREIASQDFFEINEELEEDIPITNLDTPPPPPPEMVATPEVITVVEDTEEVEETVIESTETSQDEYIEEKVIAVEDVFVEEVEEEIEVAFAVVESVPIFPGCTGSKNELRACFNDGILKHVKNTFQYPDRARDLGVQGKVYVMFVVDSKGYISNIRTRGPDTSLEKEASRIISALPKMIPGRQRDKPVNVPYSIPITLKVDGHKARTKALTTKLIE